MKVIPAPSDLEKSNLPFPKHVASLVLQTGIIVCVLALLPRGLLEISLCNSPKELALQFFGLTAACLCSPLLAGSLSIGRTCFSVRSCFSVSYRVASPRLTDGKRCGRSG